MEKEYSKGVQELQELQNKKFVLPAAGSFEAFELDFESTSRICHTSFDELLNS
jgi:hypothetical protein